MQSLFLAIAYRDRNSQISSVHMRNTPLRRAILRLEVLATSQLLAEFRPPPQARHRLENSHAFRSRQPLTYPFSSGNNAFVRVLEFTLNRP